MLFRSPPKYYSRQRLFRVGIGHVDRDMSSQYDAHAIPDAMEDIVSDGWRVRKREVLVMFLMDVGREMEGRA